jgi:glycosyltransferase involved in cell wall biosynthesis
VSAADAFDVVLPTHRRPHTLPYAIRSVLAQSHSALTLHVIGDGCGDDTERVVRGFDDPRLRFHRFPKAYGFGYASRNTILAASDAPWIAYMTDDDLWFPDHLERGLAALRQRELDLVAFRSLHVRFPDRLDPFFFAFDWHAAGAGTWLRHWFMGAVTCLHRRTVFDKVGYWDDALFRFGDRDFYNRVRVSPAARSAYVDHPTVLRFYAMHWDGRYAREAEAPQRRYLARVSDPDWRRSLQERLADARGLDVRLAQGRDFLEFGVRSGPRFLRFWWQRLRPRRTRP